VNRLGKLVCAIVALAAVALAIDFWTVTRKERLLSNAVAQISGRIGSIPVWPLGTEYRITLTAVPDGEQLNALKIANQMRGWVGISFVDCELNEEEAHRLRESLPNCHLFIVRDGKMTSIAKPPLQPDEPYNAPHPLG
jgi:hypothetical protein